MELFKGRLEIGGRIDIYLHHADHDHNERAETLAFRVGPVHERAKTEMLPLPFTITDSQEILFTATSGVDAHGDPVPFAGPVTATSQDITKLTVRAGDDGAVPPNPIANAFWIGAAPGAIPGGPYTVDVTDGVGVASLVGTITGGTEVGITGTFGTPVEQAPAVPVP